jgi:hypothetical protein
MLQEDSGRALKNNAEPKNAERKMNGNHYFAHYLRGVLIF